MITLKENHVEWALKHLQKFPHSDFYPRLFEFQAISHNWEEVKKYLLSLDLDTYNPKSPLITLAPKPNGNYRCAHQLDPLDSLIYTALLREICEGIEQYRIPQSEEIVYSYRIKPNMEGSFFANDQGWDAFASRSDALADKFRKGYVIVADITDFYNQIYTHRINNLIVEAGKGIYDEQAKITENFLLSLNKNTSRGIPVGPAPSIILAELIMGNIDKKISGYTKNFVRYVDDIRIFFDKPEDAIYALHDLTMYLYSYHRLVLSGEKTEIIPVRTFREKYMKDEKEQEKATLKTKANELATEKMDELVKNLPEYSPDFDYDDEYEKTLAKIFDEEQLKLLSSTYYELFKKALEPPRDYGLLKHVLRQSKTYRIRSIVPLVLDRFYAIRPVIREAVIYLDAVINDTTVITYKTEFESLYSHFLMKLPFINIWVSRLLQNDSFNKIDLPSDYDNILSTREQALIALRRKDTTWVRGFRDNIDVLGPWEKRAVIYSMSILPLDEMRPLVKTIASNGDILEKSLALFVLSNKKSKK